MSIDVGIYVSKLWSVCIPECIDITWICIYINAVSVRYISPPYVCCDCRLFSVMILAVCRWALMWSALDWYMNPCQPAPLTQKQTEQPSRQLWGDTPATIGISSSTPMPSRVTSETTSTARDTSLVRVLLWRGRNFLGRMLGNLVREHDICPDALGVLDCMVMVSCVAHVWCLLY